MKNNYFYDDIIAWQLSHGRHDLPWQHDVTPYRVWVSEIMLQQTQVKTVIPYYKRFMARFLDVHSLAAAKEDEVLHYWAGLGFYARARNLHRTAQIVSQQLQGEFPDNVAALADLPGIGRSTAGAIISFAFKRPAAILDGNVIRILCRSHSIDAWPGAVSKKLWELAESYTPQQQTAVYNQGLMDLGANICTPRQPLCHLCPVTKHCLAYRNNVQHLFPKSKPKKELPLKQTMMVFIFNHEQQILLEKRPPSGIWGGLWSLPQVDLTAELTTWVKVNFGLQIVVKNTMPILKHQFSHFKLEIHPVITTLQTDSAITADVQWFSKSDITSLALATPVQRLLKKYL